MNKEMPGHQPGIPARRATSKGQLDRSAATIQVGNRRPVSLTPGERTSSGAVDICLVFDTTYSMLDKIEGLVDSMVEFVNELARLDLDWRLTTVPFGDLRVPGDDIVGGMPFVTTAQAATSLLWQMPRFNGGNNHGESSFQAVMMALGKEFRPKAVKVFVVLTDDAGYSASQVNSESVLTALKAAEVVCFVASINEPYYRAWAEKTGGKWYHIGTSMNTEALLLFLRTMLGDLAERVRAVHELGGGSVRKYLELEAQSRHSESKRLPPPT